MHSLTPTHRTSSSLHILFPLFGISSSVFPFPPFPLSTKQSSCLLCLSKAHLSSSPSQNVTSSGGFSGPPRLDYFHSSLVMLHLQSHISCLFTTLDWKASGGWNCACPGHLLDFELYLKMPNTLF